MEHMDTYCGRHATTADGHHYLIADMLGHARRYWALNLEAAQRAAAVMGLNPANVIEDPQEQA